MTIGKQEPRVIELSGKIDALSSRDMETMFNGVIDKGGYRVVVDAHDLEYISSAGLRVLLAALKKVKHHEGDIVLAALQSPVRTVIDIAGFNRLFTITDTVAEAKNRFQ